MPIRPRHDRTRPMQLAAGMLLLALTVVACGTPTSQVTPTLGLDSSTATLVATQAAPPTPLPTEPLPTLAPATATPLAPTSAARTVSRAQRQVVFDEVWRLVQDYYLDPEIAGLDWAAVREEYRSQALKAETNEAFYTIVAEMVDLLGDRHSRFMPPLQVAAEGNSPETKYRFSLCE